MGRLRLLAAISALAPAVAVAFALAVAVCAQASSAAAEPQVVLLWPGGVQASRGGRGAAAAHGAEGAAPASANTQSAHFQQERVRINEQGEHIVSNVHAPTITVFLPAPEHATGVAVLVIPGGGHAELWMDHEGYNVAAFLTAHGIAALVLKYRLAREQGSTYTVEGDALADVQRALRVIRSRSAQWGVDPDRVGVMGFSAGGELAALAATRDVPCTPASSGSDAAAPGGTGAGNRGGTAVADPLQQMSARPSFQALLYPAIPRDMVLSKNTPPAFLVAGDQDQPAISQGLAALYGDLRRAGVPAELHIYDGVGHGFGLRSGNAGPVAGWPMRFVEWLQERGLIAAGN